MTRFEYPLELFDSYYGDVDVTFDFWWMANNPAWNATFLEDSSEFGFNLSSDYTAVPDIIGWQVEIDVLSGTGQMLWDCGFDATDESGYVAFGGYFNVDGPGTYVNVAGSPYFVSSTSGHTYTGVYDVLARVADEDPYPHGYGTLERVTGASDIVLWGMRIVFFTADQTLTAVRQWPRDDSLGVNAVTRVYPPPRSGRVIGGQP